MLMSDRVESQPLEKTSL